MRAARQRAAAHLALLIASLLSPAAAEPGEVRVRLPLEYEYFSYLTGRDGREVDSRNALTAIPELEWVPMERVLLRLALALRQDFAEEERSRIFPYEAFLDLERSRWAARVGRQFIRWGRAETVRPTDVFARHDFTDFIENREEGIDAVKLDLFSGVWTLAGVWVPIFQPDVVSFRAENRWTALPEIAEVAGIGPVRLRFREGHGQEPARTLKSGEIGLRVSGSAGGWDFAAMYHHGHDRVPTVTRQVLLGIDQGAREATLALVSLHKRIHVIGGDVATIRSGWGIQAEATYTRTVDPRSEDREVDDPYLRLTGGVHRTFAPLALGQSFFVALEYALDTEVPPQGRPNQEQARGLRHVFRHAFLFSSTWSYTEFVRPSLKGFVNLEEGDFVLQPELAWQPVDPLTIVLGADLVSGPHETFFGRFRNNDRIRLRFSYTF